MQRIPELRFSASLDQEPVLLCEREDRHYYHVRCRPGTEFLDAHLTCLERMGS